MMGKLTLSIYASTLVSNCATCIYITQDKEKYYITDV